MAIGYCDDAGSHVVVRGGHPHCHSRIRPVNIDRHHAGIGGRDHRASIDWTIGLQGVAEVTSVDQAVEDAFHRVEVEGVGRA